VNIADSWQSLYINVMKKCIACLTSDKIVDFAEVIYRQISSLTVRHHLYIQTNWEYCRDHPCGWLFCFFMFVDSIVLGDGNPNNTARILWDMGKKTTQTRRHYYDICLPAYKYCLCQRLVSEMAYERWTISSSLLEEAGPLKSYVFGLALFCILPLLLPYVVLEDEVHHARINALCQNV
jgi:hypothetical protein